MQLILFSLVPHPPRGQSSASATRPHWWNLPGELNQAEYLLTRGLEAVPQTWSWHVLASFPLVSPLCPVLLWTLREREKLIPLLLWQFNLFGIFSNELWMNPGNLWMRWRFTFDRVAARFTTLSVAISGRKMSHQQVLCRSQSQSVFFFFFLKWGGHKENHPTASCYFTLVGYFSLLSYLVVTFDQCISGEKPKNRKIEIVLATGTCPCNVQVST